MKTSKVYFTNLRAKNGDNLLTKLQRLIKTAGIADIDFEDKYVAIKMHFGEPGNLAFLRPNYAKAVADVVKELGGKPFLTDYNTLYVGGRKNARDHLDSANLTDTITLPPMSEELVYRDGRIYVMCESASNKYIFGKFIRGYQVFAYNIAA